MKLADWIFDISNMRHSNRISAMEKQRVSSRERIRAIRKKMDDWVLNGIDADDLDRRIYAMEYNTQKLELEAEIQHFQDISNRIKQMKIEMVRNREKHDLDKLNDVYCGIDIEKMLSVKDYVAAAREVEKEYNRQIEYETVGSYFVEDSEDNEYMKLLNVQKNA